MAKTGHRVQVRFARVAPLPDFEKKYALVELNKPAKMIPSTASGLTPWTFIAHAISSDIFVISSVTFGFVAVLSKLKLGEYCFCYLRSSRKNSRRHNCNLVMYLV